MTLFWNLLQRESWSPFWGSDSLKALADPGGGGGHRGHGLPQTPNGQWIYLVSTESTDFTTPFYLQFEKVEAQFEKAEVQFEKGEAQFEKDEVQFEIPEIQFEKDETQIEKDKVGFEITKIQFEKIAITQFETPLGNYGMNIPACAYQPCL